MRKLIDEAVDYISGKYREPHRPYQRMTAQDFADLVLLWELSDDGNLPGTLVPFVRDLVKKWLDTAWLSIVWEARHTGFDPEKAAKEVSDEGLMAAEYLYANRPFKSGYGGPRWANISRNTRQAFQHWESGAVKGMLEGLLTALYTKHNTGLFGEKLMVPEKRSMLLNYEDKYLEPYDLLRMASDKVYDVANEYIEEPEFTFPEPDEDLWGDEDIPHAGDPGWWQGKFDFPEEDIEKLKRRPKDKKRPWMEGYSDYRDLELRSNPRKSRKQRLKNKTQDLEELYWVD